MPASVGEPRNGCRSGAPARKSWNTTAEALPSKNAGTEQPVQWSDGKQRYDAIRTASTMLIAIEGCVGIGKTTVATGLASHRGSELLLEAFELNPFLPAFYERPTETAIETEFSFLLLHFHQLKRIRPLASQSELIADFHLGKDLLYADLNLTNGPARRLFQDLYSLCLQNVPQPGLLIFLSAPTALVIERIRARQREFELAIDPEYFAAVNAAYEKRFCEYPGRKLRVQMDEWDFVKDVGLYTALNDIIEEELDRP